MFYDLEIAIWLLPAGDSGKYVIYYSNPPLQGQKREWQVITGDFSQDKVTNLNVH